ncbi:Asp23/Gls24 family envelope stress response protein [Peptostreptococcus sp. D1]|uniref:Asp23/Gls24 family envelope stress response protein n=1 Tax=Peptostreptococcus sp. D1 TaxID=72304 RepID=UPI0008E3E003|nr:Asp23/Gls24 family envelope stress response protein [Peptostreptococcus sp. D1]SFE53276.1 Uncharacterized conserved protein YloU, alkaline shock protein (Asp23) family [Peptostreptococcus sp. D1]
MENNENTVVEVIDNGKLTFDGQVISKIVDMAVKNVEGVAIVKSGGGFSLVGKSSGSLGINVEVGETEVAVDLRLVLEFGKNAREKYAEVKALITDQVFTMTGLKVIEVNAKIEDVVNSEAFKELSDK